MKTAARWVWCDAPLHVPAKVRAGLRAGRFGHESQAAVESRSIAMVLCHRLLLYGARMEPAWAL